MCSLVTVVGEAGAGVEVGLVLVGSFVVFGEVCTAVGLE